MTANLNENPSSCECQLDSIVQGTGRESEKIRGVERYLVQWKGFIAESNTWEKKEDLENAKELVDEFEGRLETEVRRQKGIEER